MKKPHLHIGMILAILAISLISCGGSDDDDDPERYSIVYKVEGTATSVDISFVNPTGGDTNVDPATPPFTSESFTFFEDDYVRVSAWNNNHDNSSVIVTILVDGQVYVTETSTGPYAYAHVGGFL